MRPQDLYGLMGFIALVGALVVWERPFTLVGASLILGGIAAWMEHRDDRQK